MEGLSEKRWGIAKHQNYLESLCLVAKYVHFLGYFVVRGSCASRVLLST